MPAVPEVEWTMGRGVPGGNPREAYLLLAGFYALASVQLLVTIVRPPLPTTHVGWQAGMMGIALTLLIVSGALALLARGAGALPLVVIGGLILISLTTFRAAGGQGQLMAGGYLTLLGLIVGLTLSGRWLVAVVIVGSLLYLIAAETRSLMDSRSYALGMTALFAVVSLVVASLVGRLTSQATRDPLTGALNRRGLETDAVIAHERDVRSGIGTTLVEVDLDDFKSFNDRYGHAAGDDLLGRLVEDWTPVLRMTDLLGRVGGDEFVLVLPATNLEETEPLLARMRAANPSRWTAGIASWSGSESLWQALERADTSMYAHKPHRSEHHHDQ
jgi:diguanylate cyclase (GGDEF)-like protein